MSKRGLAWTPKQKEVADLLRSGLGSQAVIAKGYTKTMVCRVAKAIKSELKHPEITPKPTPKQEVPATPPGGETHIRPRVVDSVGVGEILIEPADWRVNQFGGLLILGTYEHARNTFGYNGTVGEFLCDCTQIIRKIMGLDMVATDYLWKEDNNGRRDKADQGAGVPAEAGADPDGEQEP